MGTITSRWPKPGPPSWTRLRHERFPDPVPTAIPATLLDQAFSTLTPAGACASSSPPSCRPTGAPGALRLDTPDDENRLTDPSQRGVISLVEPGREGRHIKLPVDFSKVQLAYNEGNTPMPKRAIQPRPLRGTLSQEAYLSIRRKILRGELPPGASVSRRPLAKELGMSFLPISEALQRLEQEGLVESWPRVGTRVRIPSSADVRGTYVIREALESQSARLFAEKASLNERAELRKMAEQVDAAQADASIDFFDFFSLHERLHRRIAECTGVPALAEALVKNNILIRTWLYAAVSHFREMPAHYHRDLIETLATGTPEEADAVMRRHVRHGMDEVLHRLEKYFNWDGSAEYHLPRAR